MRIETITMVYNEEFLLPFYLPHYAWTDCMNILFDTDSDDRSLEIIEEWHRNPGKINLFPFTFPDGLDDLIKVQHFNEAYKNVDCDMVILGDCDEFLFADREKIEGLPDYPAFLAISGYVYRHPSEADLDPMKPVKEQRRHGLINYGGVKVMVAQAGKGVEWKPGNHNCNIKPMENCDLIFAHWSMADLCFCIKRRIQGRRDRMSKVNVEQRMGYHLQNITEQDVINECRLYENSGRIW